MGYSTVFVPDHFDSQWGPLVALTVASEATSTLKIGSLVLSNDYRHPVVLAKEIASLALASGDRLEVGLGAGWLQEDYASSGIAYDRPGVRIERLAESVQILKALWSGKTFDFEGEHYTIRGMRGYPLPKDGKVPLTIGGGGRKILQLAAAEADVIGVNAALGSGQVDSQAIQSALPDRFDERVSWIREAAAKRYDDLEIQCLTFLCLVGPSATATVSAMASSFGLSAEQAAQVPVVIAGTVEQICELLWERRERFGFNYWIVHDHEAESFAPIVAELTGK